MLKISLRNKVPNEEIRRKTQLTDVSEILEQLKWRWADQISRQHERWTYKLTAWRPKECKRSVGRRLPRKTGCGLLWTGRNEKIWNGPTFRSI